MAAGVGIVWRDSHQSMDSSLGLQIAISVLAVDFEGGALDSRAFSRLQIRHLGGEAVALCPSQIEPQQHLSPVLRLHPTSARMYCYNRAQAVVFAAEHDPQFLLIDFLTSRLERGFGFEGGLRVFGAFLLRHFKKDPR